jgi:hypothetical protein
MGCDVDLTLAHMWFTVASQQGDSEAIHNRNTVSKHLSHEQLAISKQWVIDWGNRPWKKT